MTPAEVLGLIKEKEVKFVDFRFTDTKGKEQHVTVPSHTVDEDLFEEGKMFDGSSIAGWKGINESDMILMPDPASAVVDIFTDEVTMNLRCKSRRGLPEIDRHRGYRFLRAGERVFRLRSRLLGRLDAGRVLQG
jgi:glutamine synthetase